MIDLHCHSTASDGSYAPSELIKMAEKLNITHFALTDHDTTDGISEFINTKSDIKRIPGIEISVEIPKGELHIVGLFIDINNKDLKEMEEEVKYYRIKRNEKMLAGLSKLVKKNVKISDLISNPNAQLGRPHVARYLLKNNVVTSIQEAFEKYLQNGAPLAYKKQQVEVERALSVIKNAGGLSFVAHPYTLKLSDNELLSLMKEYKNIGLDGIEAFSSHNPEDKKNIYVDIAKETGLLISGGSDFHGENGKVSSLGANTLEFTDDDILKPIYERLKMV